MRALVTGGAGRLGVDVCRKLIEDGFKVRVFDLENERNRRSIAGLGGTAEVCWGDITQSHLVSKALEEVDVVVHMAGVLPPVTFRNPELAERVNVGGTRVLVDVLKQNERRIPLVFTSSVAVFGPCPDATEPVSVDVHVPRPIDEYGKTKLAAEDVIRESGVDYLILRLTAIMYYSHEVSDLKRMFSVPLDNRVEFCHPDDLAVAILNGVRDFDALKGNTLVVSGGAGQRMLYKDMVGSIFDVMGLPLPPAEKFTREPFYLDWYDTDSSQRLLKYQRKGWADYLKDYSSGLRRRYSPLFLPFMRYFVGPLFGKAVTRFM
jgi:nucleoside-diphosphate-sugar epimerase